MSEDDESLIALVVRCTFAAVLGVRRGGLLRRSSYTGDLGRVQFIQFARVLVYVALAVILVLRGVSGGAYSSRSRWSSRSTVIE